MVTQSEHVTRFCFEEVTSTFTCGPLTVDGATVPVFAFATFANEIHVYYNLSGIKTGALRTLLADDEGLDRLMAERGLDRKAGTPRDRAALNRYLLYGRPRKLREPEEGNSSEDDDDEEEEESSEATSREVSASPEPPRQSPEVSASPQAPG